MTLTDLRVQVRAIEAAGAACPTCPEAHRGVCCKCGERGDGVTVRPDPYASEINGDDTEHAICDPCYGVAAADI